MNRPLVVGLTALVALALFGVGAYMYKRSEVQAASDQAATQFGAMVRPHSPVVGPISAPVTIVEFFDPACEACRAFYPYVKQILATHPRDVRLVVRYVPFHGEASVVGVRILEAARAQGRFDAVMEAILREQPVWANHQTPAAERAWDVAKAAGLDVDRARTPDAESAVDRLLEQESTDLKAVGIKATPTFFVNGKPLPEADPRVLADMVAREVESAAKGR